MEPTEGEELSQQPAPRQQLPAWDAPFSSRQPSLWQRLTTPMTRTGGTASPWQSTRPAPRPEAEAPKPIPAEASDKAATLSSPPAAYAQAPPLYPYKLSRSSAKSALARRFDALLPPHRTYLGPLRLRRRAFLRFVLLPALTLLILVPLILGLVFGLRARAAADAAAAYAVLPLPPASGPDNNIYTGDLTYFGPGLGACGWTSNDSSPICAVSHLVFDAAGAGESDPNANPLCGRRIRIERAPDPDNAEGSATANHTATVTVVDRCVGCAALDLDLSPGVFALLANASEGRVVGSWQWLPAGE